MRSLLRVLIFVVPFFSQGVFAGPVSVTYTIYVTGTVSSSMNSSVGYDGYKFTGTIPATTNVPGANTFSTTTDSTGKYNPSNFFVTGKQTVTPVSEGGQLKVKFNVPFTMSLKRLSTDAASLVGFPDNTPYSVPIEQNVTASATTATVTVTKVVNRTFTPPKPPEPGISTFPTAGGIQTTIYLPPPLTADEWERATLMLGTGANSPLVGCPDGANLQKVRITTDLFSYIEPPGVLYYDFRAAGYGNVNHNVRVCLVSKYNKGSDGAVATLLPGPSTVEAIRDIGLAPLGNAAQFLRVSSAGYQYNHNGGYEKWLLRGITSPWSYLLRSGVLRNSPAGGFSPTTDPLVTNFNAFTSGTVTYQHAAYVYDHPTLLTQDPTQLIPDLQLENLDSDYRFSTAANGNYFFNLRGLNEKQISGDTSEGLYKPWIIEPNGLLSQCVAWGESGVEKCIPSHFVPTSVYNSPYTLTRAHEFFLESKYKFVTGTAPANAGLGEKWYRSTITGLWYYIKSNGNVYRYDSGSVAGILAGLDTFVFTTSPLVYANPLPELVNLIP